MFNLFRIAINAFRESVREPVYFLMLIAALLLIGHYPSMAIFAFSEQLKLVVDSSMATALMFGLVVAVLCAGTAVAREMRNGTVLLLLAKPVSRWSFILGKIVGIGVAAALFTALCAFGTIVSVYIAAVDQFRPDMTVYGWYLGVLAIGCLFGMAVNFWRGGAFSEASVFALVFLVPLFALWCWIFRTAPNVISLTDLALAQIMVGFAVTAMAAMAVMFATRLDVVPNMCCCAALFFLGLISSYLFQRETGWFWLDVLFSALYAAIPNWQYFWLADALAVQRPIPISYVLTGLLYLLLYIGFAAMWAVALFREQEVAADLRN